MRYVLMMLLVAGCATNKGLFRTKNGVEPPAGEMGKDREVCVGETQLQRALLPVWMRNGAINDCMEEKGWR